jgi:hypothetical protein
MNRAPPPPPDLPCELGMPRFERAQTRRPILWTEVLSLAGEHWTDTASAWIQRCRLLWQFEDPSSAYVNPKSLPPRSSRDCLAMATGVLGAPIATTGSPAWRTEHSSGIRTGRARVRARDSPSVHHTLVSQPRQALSSGTNPRS